MKILRSRLLIEYWFSRLRDELVSVQERKILETIYENPNLGYRKISDILGIHMEQVRRTLGRIKRKLKRYEYCFN